MSDDLTGNRCIGGIWPKEKVRKLRNIEITEKEGMTKYILLMITVARDVVFECRS